DDPENPRFIETVPRRGYRFIAPVAVVPPKLEHTSAKLPENDVSPVSLQTPAVPASVPVVPSVKATGRRYWVPATVLAVCVGIILSGLLLWHYRFVPRLATRRPTVQMRKSVAVLGFQNLSRRSDEAWL